jgi:hypothetical protein
MTRGAVVHEISDLAKGRAGCAKCLSMLRDLIEATVGSVGCRVSNQ